MSRTPASGRAKSGSGAKASKRRPATKVAARPAGKAKQSPAPPKPPAKAAKKISQPAKKTPPATAEPQVPRAKPPKQAKAPGKDAPHKEKTIRDSFNMPAADYALIAALKKRALAAQREVKKSELLRAGVRLLAAMSDEALHLALAALPSIKTGRPRKKHK